MRYMLLGLSVAVLAFACPAEGGTPFETSLTVREYTGVVRKEEPVTSGVPIPQGAAKQTSELMLVDQAAKKYVPCQYTVLARWPDGSIKWVLLDFQSTVDAKGTATYTLCNRAPKGMSKPAKPAAPAKPLIVEDKEDAVTIRTGSFSFRISKQRGTLLDKVELDGTEIISPEYPCEAILKMCDDKVYKSTFDKSPAVKIENDGPMRSCIHVVGSFRTPEGKGVFGGKARYEFRIMAYAGKPYVKMAFTMKNDGRYATTSSRKKQQWLHFKSVALDVPIDSSLGSEWKFGCGDGSYPLSDENPITMNQWLKYPSLNRLGWIDAASEKDVKRESLAGISKKNMGFYYLVREGEAIKATGEKAQGWASLATGEKQVITVAVRDFWQNFPRGLGADRSKMTVFLWPEGGHWPRTKALAQKSNYQFEGNKYKTAEILLSFDGAATGPGALAQCDRPLFARAPFEWYRSTNALWPLATVNDSGATAELKEAVTRYNRLQKAKVHSDVGDPAGRVLVEPGVWHEDSWGKVSILSLRDECPDVFCGFMNFGDLVWGFGYCSLFYDWTYGMLIQHLRFDDPDIFYMANQMAGHRYDVDKGYSFQHYEKGHHGHRERIMRDVYRREGFRPHSSHTWNRGLYLHWVLTGDRRSYEAAEQNAKSYYNTFDKSKEKRHCNEFRIPAWAIESSLAKYEYTGDKEYLAKALDIFARVLSAMERDHGSKGHILKGGSQSSQFTSYLIEPTARLHYITKKPEVAGFLKRVLDWHRSKLIRGGGMKGGKYVPINFAPGASSAGADEEDIKSTIVYGFAFADGYAYLYDVFKRQRDINFARKIFKDTLFYYGSPMGEVDPKYRTPLGYHFRGYTDNLCAKVHAFSTRYDQLYLLTEEKISGKR